jgi:hypothetical protein
LVSVGAAVIVCEAVAVVVALGDNVNVGVAEGTMGVKVAVAVAVAVAPCKIPGFAIKPIEPIHSTSKTIMPAINPIQTIGLIDWAGLGLSVSGAAGAGGATRAKFLKTTVPPIPIRTPKIKDARLIRIFKPPAPPTNGIAGVGVGVTVDVGDGVPVAVAVDVLVGVGVNVRVAVGVAEGVEVFVGGEVRVGVAVSVESAGTAVDNSVRGSIQIASIQTRFSPPVASFAIARM